MRMLDRRRQMGAKALDYNDRLMYRLNNYDCNTIDKAFSTGVYPIQDNWGEKTLLVALDVYKNQTGLGGGPTLWQHTYVSCAKVVYPYPNISMSRYLPPYTKDYDARIGINIYAVRTHIYENNTKFEKEVIRFSEEDDHYEIYDFRKNSGTDKVYFEPCLDSPIYIGRMQGLSGNRYGQAYFYEVAWFNRRISDDELQWWINKYKYLLKNKKGQK